MSQAFSDSSGEKWTDDADRSLYAMAPRADNELPRRATAADWYFSQTPALGFCVSSRKAECVITVLFAPAEIGIVQRRGASHRLKAVQQFRSDSANRRLAEKLRDRGALQAQTAEAPSKKPNTDRCHK